jgi:hypothetical protein
MSKEIVLTLKNGKIFRGDEYNYNHFSKCFELSNFTTSIQIDPDEIKKISKGHISENSCDNTGGF